MTACTMPSSSASSDFVFRAGAGRHREIDVEHATDHRRGIENLSRVRRQAVETTLHEPVSDSGQLVLTFRAQTPTAVLVPHRAVLEQHADELRREQRIALGVSQEVRDELAARLAAEHAREPLLDLGSVSRGSAISWKRSSRSRRLRRSSASPRVSSVRIVSADEDSLDDRAAPSTCSSMSHVPRPPTACPRARSRSAARRAASRRNATISSNNAYLLTFGSLRGRSQQLARAARTRALSCAGRTGPMIAAIDLGPRRDTAPSRRPRCIGR